MLPTFWNDTFIWHHLWLAVFKTTAWKEYTVYGIWSNLYVLTPSLRRPCIHAIFFRPHVGQRVNTHSVFWELGRKPCQHATRGCDKRWMTCIHAGVSRSPREHASVPPGKRHCPRAKGTAVREWVNGFLPNPFIHDRFCWRSRHKFVKTVL